MARLAALFTFALALLALAFALPVGASSVSAGTPVTLGTFSPGTASAWGGNITQVNLTINSTTLHWQGFYGSLTGSLKLASGNASNLSTLKTWPVSTISGQVYVSTSSNVDLNDSMSWCGRLRINPTVSESRTFCDVGNFNWRVLGSSVAKSLSSANSCAPTRALKSVVLPALV